MSADVHSFASGDPITATGVIVLVPGGNAVPFQIAFARNVCVDQKPCVLVAPSCWSLTNEHKMSSPKPAVTVPPITDETNPLAPVQVWSVNIQFAGRLISSISKLPGSMILVSLVMVPFWVGIVISTPLSNPVSLKWN